MFIFIPQNLSMRILCLFTIIVFLFNSCKDQTGTAPSSNPKSVTLDSAQRHSLDHALDGLVAFEGYEVSLFAAEPMLQNPTNMDIDHRGRVYVTEAYNYRPHISNVPTKFEGDRIMILEDTDGDGKADVSKVFYQGPEVNAPLGICVLGREVIVSQSPYIWKFTDTDGDDKADKKEILFQGIQGIQDDHGVHALTLGPDGRFYFSMGNAGKTIFDASNKPLKTITGVTIDLDHFKQGLILRGGLDGSRFEVVGQNFRNNYECALDSYGGIWQSDNDDDGNRGTRINYILEYGNYGYRDQLTNASWQTFRTNWEDSIPLRHWHQNDPGVVPNLLNNGSGSPCGLMIYEGDLIPELKGSLLHAEALHNVIRAYKPTQGVGASLTATSTNVVLHQADSWFRPVDVCTAPDGSIFIADWYDPGVGGHYAGDQLQGRVYRLAPKGSIYKSPNMNIDDASQAVIALKSPNLSTRSQAQLKLRSLGVQAIPALKEGLISSNSLDRSRLLWIMCAVDKSYLDTALLSQDEAIKMAGIRIARSLGSKETLHALDLLIEGKASDQVWRECAIALKNLDQKSMLPYWLTLASRYTHSDRWFLEALGIAGDGQWDEIMAAWLKTNKDPMGTEAQKDIVWRSRSKYSLPYLAQQVNSSDHPTKERMKYLRAIDFNPSSDKNKTLLSILASNQDSVIAGLIVKTLDPIVIQQDIDAMHVVKTWLDKTQGSAYLDLVEKFKPKSETARLKALLTQTSDDQLRTRVARSLININSFKLYTQDFNSADAQGKILMIKAIGPIGSNETLAFLHKTANQAVSSNLKTEAFRQIGKSWGGEEFVVKLLSQNEIPTEFIPAAIEGPSNAWRKPIRTKVLEYATASQSEVKTYNIADLVIKTGNIENGKSVFIKTCATCHQVNKQGTDFGPSLDEIGSKYGKDAIYTSIIDPNKSINFGYEGEQIITKNGGIHVGIKINESGDQLVIKSIGGQLQSIDKVNIKERIALKQSLMTPNLYLNMTENELVDLVEYLSSLKKAM